MIKGGTALAKVFNKEIGILSQGPVNTYVYLGVKNGKFDYVGITNNPARRALEHGARFERLQILTKDPVTRKQARAIEQVLKESNQFSNIRNSISPARSWYSEAINWGTNWLKSHKVL